MIYESDNTPYGYTVYMENGTIIARFLEYPSLSRWCASRWINNCNEPNEPVQHQSRYKSSDGLFLRGWFSCSHSELNIWINLLQCNIRKKRRITCHRKIDDDGRCARCNTLEAEKFFRVRQTRYNWPACTLSRGIYIIHFRLAEWLIGPAHRAYPVRALYFFGN